jgi:ABC-2 type transport system ATP-binding protein
MVSEEPIIEVSRLRKQYGSVVAAEDVSFTVRPGEIFGMVGPNGAGKTTTIECIEGLRRPDSGAARVLGLDPMRDGYALRERIGVQLQTATLQDRIKVWEALDMMASLYTRQVDWRPLLDQLGLAEKRDAFYSKLSGGQKQRLFIALALVNDPEVVFLDELTTGLDPQARHAMWDLVREIRGRGKTVFLTTHFMEEAERLCDRVAIMDHGRIVALDSPENLVQSIAAEHRVVFTADGDAVRSRLEGLPTVTRVEYTGDRVTVSGHSDRVIVEVVNALSADGFHFRDLRTEQPSLEDVFLALTGRGMRE